MRATSVALMEAASQPARILTVTGRDTAETTARTISPASLGFLSRALPSPLPVTLRTGQPMLMSMAEGGTSLMQPR